MTTTKESKSVDELEEAQHLALGEIIAFLKGNKNEDPRAEFSKSVLGGISRSLATYRVKDATQLTFIRLITNDPDERAKYLRATMPTYCPPTELLK